MYVGVLLTLSIVKINNKYVYVNVCCEVMVFNSAVNNISAISWQSVVSVGETGVSGENHRPVASHLQMTC